MNLSFQPPDFDEFLAEDALSTSSRERTAIRSYSQSLMSHPDCTDPDHPGCPSCVNEQDLPEGAML